MSRFPRYTTFSAEERYRVLGVPAETSSASPTRRGKPLREFTGSVTYPDGTCGTCHYQRQGPRWHILTFRYRWNDHEALLARLYHNKPLEQNVVAIEQLIQEKAADAYQQAMRHELKDRFLRATPPRGQTAGPPWPMSARRARELAGRYAVCYRLPVTPPRLLALHGPFETIEEANGVWRDKGDMKCVVACACRWSRRCELPHYNPLYAQHDPRPTAAASSD